MGSTPIIVGIIGIIAIILIIIGILMSMGSMVDEENHDLLPILNPSSQAAQVLSGSAPISSITNASPVADKLAIACAYSSDFLALENPDNDAYIEMVKSVIRGEKYFSYTGDTDPAAIPLANCNYRPDNINSDDVKYEDFILAYIAHMYSKGVTDRPIYTPDTIITPKAMVTMRGGQIIYQTTPWYLKLFGPSETHDYADPGFATKDPSADSLFVGYGRYKLPDANTFAVRARSGNNLQVTYFGQEGNLYMHIIIGDTPSPAYFIFGDTDGTLPSGQVFFPCQQSETTRAFYSSIPTISVTAPNGRKYVAIDLETQPPGSAIYISFSLTAPADVISMNTPMGSFP